MTSENVDVVAAVICRGGRFLVCKRNSAKRHGGLWEFPGGKVLRGETFEMALGRELVEELALELSGVGELLYSGAEDDSHFEIHFIQCDVSGSPRVLEHEAISWLAPDELTSYDFAPVDRKFVEACISERLNP